MICSIIPPPSVDCRKISNGRAGSIEGSLTSVSLVPTARVIEDAMIPSNGPLAEMSNMSSLFLGRDLKVVAVLVTPVINDGTNTGTDIFTPFVAATIR